MLALLGASLLLTAIIVRSTYTSAVNLTQTAKMLEDNLYKKEGYINQAINTPAGFNRFKKLSNNSADGLQCLQEFTTERNIIVLTYKGNNLTYWSDITYIPNRPIKDGYSFIKPPEAPNGYYEVIKKSEGDFSVIFLIPVKINYAVQNHYLQNTFSTDLLKDNNIDIADFMDGNTYAIHSLTGVYLFAVKEIHNEVNYRFFYFELVIWLLTFIVICILVQNICF
jgi:two-component system nitrogen regulation sensor histidine kinase NtrY